MPDNKDKKIDLDVRSTAGTWSHPFPANSKVQLVIDEAIEHFHLSAGPGISYVLKLQDGQTLAPGETLAQLGLRDGTIVILQASQAQDG